jgi:hypothetical protein
LGVSHRFPFRPSFGFHCGYIGGNRSNFIHRRINHRIGLCDPIENANPNPISLKILPTYKINKRPLFEWISNGRWFGIEGIAEDREA